MTCAKHNRQEAREPSLEIAGTKAKEYMSHQTACSKQSCKGFARYRDRDLNLGIEETEVFLQNLLISLLERTGATKLIKAVSFQLK